MLELLESSGTSQAAPPASLGEKPLLHEIALCGFGLLVAWGLTFRAGLSSPLLAETLAVCLGCGLLMGAGARWPRLWRVRLLAALGFSWWMFRSVERIVPALGLAEQDALLQAADELLFGSLPALRLQSWRTPWLSELLSACYLSYQVFLHVALLGALAGPPARAARLYRRVFCAVTVGLLGYLLLPARGPAAATPALFGSGGAGPLSALNAWLVAQGSGVFDVFPSLHVLLSLVLLAHERREHPTRAALLAIVLPGIVLSTLYLGYHYAVDLLAAGLLFAVLRVSPVWEDTPC